MSLGPIEIICIKFPETLIKDEIALALKELVEHKTIRIIDILFIRKSAQGAVTITEIDEMDDVDHSLLDPAIADISGLISEEDVEDIATQLDNSSFAALMLLENTWATRFRDAVLNANGELLLSERIPHRVVETLLKVKAGNTP
jgi:hypothetical protein